MGVVDTDIQSPTLDLLFRLGPGASLADYLLGRCEIEATAQQAGGSFGPGPGVCTSYRPGPGRPPCARS